MFGGCRCQAAKPPNAHHCSICGVCVVDMDHHCPFINNCVGRGNNRPFLLFLFWVSVAMFYAISVFVYSLVHHNNSIMKVRASFRCPRVAATASTNPISCIFMTETSESGWLQVYRRVNRSSRPPKLLELPALTILTLTRLPKGPFAAVLLLLTCIVVLLMVGSLCLRHWWLAIRGTTYLGSLKGETVSTGGVLSPPLVALPKPHLDCLRHWWLAIRGTTYLGSLKGETVSTGGALSSAG